MAWTPPFMGSCGECCKPFDRPENEVPLKDGEKCRHDWGECSVCGLNFHHPNARSYRWKGITYCWPHLWESLTQEEKDECEARWKLNREGEV